MAALHENEAGLLFSKKMAAVYAWFCLTFCPSFYLQCSENLGESKLKVFLLFF